VVVKRRVFIDPGKHSNMRSGTGEEFLKSVTKTVHKRENRRIDCYYLN